MQYCRQRRRDSARPRHRCRPRGRGGGTPRYPCSTTRWRNGRSTCRVCQGCSMVGGTGAGRSRCCGGGPERSPSRRRMQRRSLRAAGTAAGRGRRCSAEPSHSRPRKRTARRTCPAGGTRAGPGPRCRPSPRCRVSCRRSSRLRARRARIAQRSCSGGRRHSQGRVRRRPQRRPVPGRPSVWYSRCRPGPSHSADLLCRCHRLARGGGTHL